MPPLTPVRVAVEWLTVGLLGLLAYFWLIPNQTTADPFAALQPGLLPSICALAILILAAVQAVRDTRSLQSRGNQPAVPARAQPSSWRAVVPTMGTTAVALVLLEFAGMAATAAFLIPALMLILGERRYLRIAVVTICCVLPFTPLFS